MPASALARWVTASSAPAVPSGRCPSHHAATVWKHTITTFVLTGSAAAQILLIYRATTLDCLKRGRRYFRMPMTELSVIPPTHCACDHCPNISVGTIDLSTLTANKGAQYLIEACFVIGFFGK